MISHERYLEALRIKEAYELQAKEGLALNGTLSPSTMIKDTGMSLKLRNALAKVFKGADIDRIPLSELSQVSLTSISLLQGIGPATIQELVAIGTTAGVEIAL
jgi:hypothetical protein